MADAALLGLVLGGGKSTRMGRDKALLPLGTQTFVERLLGVLQIETPEAVNGAVARPCVARTASLDVHRLIMRHRPRWSGQTPVSSVG